MGFLIAITNALAVSFQDVLVKRLKGENKFFLIWLRMAAAAPVLAILVTVFTSWSIPAAPFWWLILGVSLPIEIVQFYLGYTAIQRSPLSLVTPLHSSTSIFLIPIGYVILGELPTPIGFVGVLTIVAGSFFLGWRFGETRNIGESLRNVFTEPGSFLVIVASFLVSFSITVIKRSFQYAPPLLTAFYLITALAVALIPLLFFRSGRADAPARSSLLAGLGISSGFSLALHYIGLSLLPAVYYISVKRTSILFNVLAGRIFFREDHTRERFLGALLMVAGVVLIALG